jgi:hypothetical protein
LGNGASSRDDAHQFRNEAEIISRLNHALKESRFGTAF